MTAHILTIDDATLDKYVNYLKYQYSWNSDPIGFMIENASSDPKVTRIDKNENEFNPDPDFFYNHELFQWPKCLLSEAGVQTDGDDYIGTGLDITGASGDVMAYIPNGQYMYRYEEDADVQIYKWAPFYSNHRGFDYHPHCYAGGGTLHDHFYVGVYIAGLKDDNGTLKFNSCTGVQPWTGGEMYSLAFTSGSTEFTVGETLTGATSTAYGIVVDYNVSSGTWAGADAAGTVYLRQTSGTFTGEDLNGSVAGSDCASISGTATSLSLTIDNALQYAANKGAGWTISDIYSLSWIQGLLYTQWGTRNSQTAIGKGIVDLPTGAGYAGLLNGANNINLNIDSHGNGMGDGTDGLTPVSCNNLNDLWGECWEFIAGINLYNSDGSYRVTKQGGTGVLAGTLPEGSYETGAGTIPLVDGYFSTVQTDPLGGILFIPATVGDVNSGDTKGFCDYLYSPRYNPSSVLSGGSWAFGLKAGVGYRSSSYMPSISYQTIGARLKYIPQS